MAICNRAFYQARCQHGRDETAQQQVGQRDADYDVVPDLLPQHGRVEDGEDDQEVGGDDQDAAGYVYCHQNVAQVPHDGEL